jgi:phospholipid/cholesterol/gamma-HCH transport system substrate-binding protein
MENRSHALAAGLFVLLFGVAAAAAVWWLGQSDDSVDRYVLWTRKNVTGLNVQATVRYRGIRAGKVDSIIPAADDPRIIQVNISVDSRYKLTKGTTAQLGYQGLTGLAYVQLEDDDESLEPLKVGAGGAAPKIELKSTLFDSLGEKAGDIVAQITLVSARLATILDEKNARNIARTLDNLATASESMRELPAVVAVLRSGLSADNLQRLQQILVHVEKTAGEAAPIATDLRNLVRSMNKLSEKFDGVAGQGKAVGDEINSTTLPRANALMRELNSNARQLNQLLESLESNPQMLIFGRDSVKPGPGENGFTAPAK